MTQEEILAVEARVNQAILANFTLNITTKPLQEAIDEGAMALFGEKYDAEVRTIIIGDESTLSYELCGGTHVEETGDIGLFLITYEGSIASGVRRIEAVTGWQAYQYARYRMNLVHDLTELYGTNTNDLYQNVQSSTDSLATAEKEISKLRSQAVSSDFMNKLENTEEIKGIKVLKLILPNGSMETLREMADRFRQKYPSGVALLTSVQGEKPILVAVVTEDLTKKGLHAGKLVKQVAGVVGGGGGGRPTLAQAGGTDPSKLAEALDQVNVYINDNLK